MWGSKLMNCFQNDHCVISIRGHGGEDTVKSIFFRAKLPRFKSRLWQILAVWTREVAQYLWGSFPMYNIRNYNTDSTHFTEPSWEQRKLTGGNWYRCLIQIFYHIKSMSSLLQGTVVKSCSKLCFPGAQMTSEWSRKNGMQSLDHVQSLWAVPWPLLSLCCCCIFL